MTLKNLLIIFISAYVLQLIIGIVTLYFTTTYQVNTALDNLTKRIQDDIKYEDGNWNILQYNADPEVPGRNRMYVFSIDGFVIDRWRPIAGFLDTSDFKKLLSYQEPQTIHTITNQTWRMYSLPITDQGNTVGVITVSNFKPRQKDKNETDNIDNYLKENADLIKEKITVLNGKINTDNLDVRDVPYDISFQIVDQYNSILVKNNNSSSLDRIPNFIDPSYVQKEIQSPTNGQIWSKDGKDAFMVKSKTLYDQNHNPIGVIIAARTMDDFYGLIKVYILVKVLLGALVSLVFAWIVSRLSKKVLHKLQVHQPTKLMSLQDIKTIGFLPKESVIEINNTKIPLTYATNQYYICQALFSNPKRKWEVDQLLDKLGEEHSKEGWRKVYDAMVVVNKKIATMAHIRLIVTNNKTYQINPDLLSKII